jgi:hypothetical protein
LVLLRPVSELVGVFATVLEVLNWVAFLGGMAFIGVGLMVDSGAKADVKSSAAATI